MVKMSNVPSPSLLSLEWISFCTRRVMVLSCKQKNQFNWIILKHFYLTYILDY
jgi:hypothetical protein